MTKEELIQMIDDYDKQTNDVLKDIISSAYDVKQIAHQSALKQRKKAVSEAFLSLLGSILLLFFLQAFGVFLMSAGLPGWGLLLFLGPIIPGIRMIIRSGKEIRKVQKTYNLMLQEVEENSISLQSLLNNYSSTE